jgi:hypothetical protein
VDLYGGHGTSELLIPIGCRNEYLAEQLLALTEYPLYDEEDHSALEMEAADEAWDQYLEFETHRDLERRARRAEGRPLENDKYGNDKDDRQNTAPSPIGSEEWLGRAIRRRLKRDSGEIRDWYCEPLGSQRVAVPRDCHGYRLPCHGGSLEFVEGRIINGHSIPTVIRIPARLSCRLPARTVKEYGRAALGARAQRHKLANALDRARVPAGIARARSNPLETFWGRTGASKPTEGKHDA